MKRANNLIEKIADVDNLRLAFWKARKGKSYTNAVEKYRNRLDEHLLELREEILSAKVKVGDYRFFNIYEPKEREICASAFSEQVLHHALMNVCHAYFERKQIYDSYASRKGKGTYAALERAKKYSHKFDFYLKLDVRKFFGSIDHQVLKEQMLFLFKDKELLHIFEAIIDSYPNEARKGLPIGNLTSQYFANHYLSALDHYIKEDLQCKAYVRYMDDMVLWHSDKEFLKDCLAKINSFVEAKLALILKPPLLQKTDKGLPFLGYLIFPYFTRLKQQSKKRFICKLRTIEEDYHHQLISEEEAQKRALPLIAFTQHADTRRFREEILLGMASKKIKGHSS